VGECRYRAKLVSMKPLTADSLALDNGLRIQDTLTSMHIHDCLVEHGSQFVQGDWLYQVMAKAGLRASLAIGLRAITAQGDCKVWSAIANFPNELPSVTIGEANIGDKNVAICLRNFPKRLLFRASTSNVMSDHFEVETKGHQRIGVVFDDEYSQRMGRFQSSHLGSVANPRKVAKQRFLVPE
jgi:hypothetical protein